MNDPGHADHDEHDREGDRSGSAPQQVRPTVEHRHIGSVPQILQLLVAVETHLHVLREGIQKPRRALAFVRASVLGLAMAGIADAGYAVAEAR